MTRRRRPTGTLPSQEKQPTEKVVQGVEPLEPQSVRTSTARQRSRRRTGSGDPVIDQKIREFLDDPAIQVENEDRLQDILETAFRMARTANRGEMKFVARSLREMGRSFRVFAPYHGVRKVSIFGSARTPPDDPAYEITRSFAREIAARGWMVITGAGPGIMQAGHEGAGKKSSFGVGIMLPFEQGANPFIAGDQKLIDFKYFFTRKIAFMKESDAFVLCPGGFGTLDEAFELLTLMQTGKTAIRPIVLLDPPGGRYWSEWLDFVRDHLIGAGLASPEDLAFFEAADNVEHAAAVIERFYSNYDSARYVGERLVLRMKSAPSPGQLAWLNTEFADIVKSGQIEAVNASPAEVKDGDVPDLARIAWLPRHNFGRIRQMIDAINRLGGD